MNEKDLRNLELDIDRLLVEEARSGKILPYTLLTFPEYEINWHHKLLAKYLNKFIAKEIRRLMIFMPPRTGKSELTSRRLPSLIHGIYPNDEILMATYNSELAGDMTVDIQRIMDRPEYQRIFPRVKITKENRKTNYARSRNEHEILPFQDPKTRLWDWHTGSFRSAGVGGSFTGRGANWILIDDPVKNREEADSHAVRENVWKFYTSTLRTRLEGEGSILVTMTRWHEDDLAGRLLDMAKNDENGDQWTVLSLPAIKESDASDEDPRAYGEPLWISKFPPDVVSRIKASVGPREWAALYQQSPRPAGGGIFQEDMFNLIEMPPKFDYTFITADTAYSEKQENDFTVFTTFGVANANQPELFVIDVFRERLKAADIERPVVEFIKRFQDSYSFRGVFIEPKGHGIYLNQVLPKYGIRIPTDNAIKEFFSDRRMNKVERANNAIPHLSSRKIYVNKNIRIKDEIMNEVLLFPRAKHDDFVDTLVDGVKFVYSKSDVSILDVL